MRILRSPLDLALIGLAVLSVGAIFLGHENPFARSALCVLVKCPDLPNAPALDKIAYDLGAGSIVTLLFYVLVVRIPDRQKRLRIQRNFRRQYKEFKEDCIGLILSVADGSYEWGRHEELSNFKAFRKYFQESVGNGQDRWGRFFNNLDERSLGEIVTYMEIFREQTEFVLASIYISDERPFAFFQRLTSIIARVRKSNADYDSKKEFLRFLWEIFAAASNVSGYLEHDVIGRAIEQI